MHKKGESVSLDCSLGSTFMAVAELSSQEGQRRFAENTLEKLQSHFQTFHNKGTQNDNSVRFHGDL